MNFKELRSQGWIRMTLTLSPEVVKMLDKMNNPDEYVNDVLVSETEDDILCLDQTWTTSE